MELNEQIENICKGLEQNNYTNEASVSRNIVDPLLSALGWSTNPNVVIPEYSIEGKRVDFALCHPASKPCIFIEVKQVGKIDGAERQLFEYAFHEGIPILILTDGKKWRFYNPSGAGGYTERLVYECDMIDDDREEILNRLNRYLNYDLVRTGKALTSILEDYLNVYRNRELLRILPQVWDSLVLGKSEDSHLLINAVKSEAERICGITPTNEQVSNFLMDTHSETVSTSGEDKVVFQPQNPEKYFI